MTAARRTALVTTCLVLVAACSGTPSGAGITSNLYSDEPHYLSPDQYRGSLLREADLPPGWSKNLGFTLTVTRTDPAVCVGLFADPSSTYLISPTQTGFTSPVNSQSLAEDIGNEKYDRGASLASIASLLPICREFTVIARRKGSNSTVTPTTTSGAGPAPTPSPWRGDRFISVPQSSAAGSGSHEVGYRLISSDQGTPVVYVMERRFLQVDTSVAVLTYYEAFRREVLTGDSGAVALGLDTARLTRTTSSRLQAAVAASSAQKATDSSAPPRS